MSNVFPRILGCLEVAILRLQHPILSSLPVILRGQIYVRGSEVGMILEICVHQTASYIYFLNPGHNRRIVCVRYYYQSFVCFRKFREVEIKQDLGERTQLCYTTC